MTTRAQLEADLKTAMRSGDDLRKSTLRMIMAAVKLAEIDHKAALDEAGIEAIVQKEAKARREAIADAEKAGRPDLAAAGRAELALVETYLPQQLSREEILAIIRAAIAQSGASGPAAMGAVMRIVGPQTKGLADGKLVSELVRQTLA